VAVHPGQIICFWQQHGSRSPGRLEIGAEFINQSGNERVQVECGLKVPRETVKEHLVQDSVRGIHSEHGVDDIEHIPALEELEDHQSCLLEECEVCIS
jgi:hypothetical protein